MSADASTPITPPTFVSNTPTATFVNTTTMGAGDLVLISSNLLEQANGDGTYFQQWYGEVENVSQRLYCAVNISFTIFGGAGSLPLISYPDGQPYQVSGLTPGGTTACLPPGAHGGMYTNNIGPSLGGVSSVTRVSYSFGGEISGMLLTYVPDTDTPTITDSLDMARGVVTGTVTASKTVSLFQFRTYVRDSQGLIQDQLEANNLIGVTLTAGTTTSFTTLFTLANAVSHLDSMSFVDGNGP